MTPFQSGRSRRARPGIRALLAGALLLGGCASAPVVPVEEQPPLDAGALARRVEAATALDRPYRIFFRWSIQEPGARMSGTGVHNVEPPDRAALFLFLTNGELAARATMIGDQLRVIADRDTRIPPAPLLWGALGIFRPGTSVLQGGEWERGGSAGLRYRTGAGEDLNFHLRGSRIEGVDLLRQGRVWEELKLTAVEGERFPRVAEYRHLDPNDIRSLRIELDTVEYVESYPASTFVLP